MEPFWLATQLDPQNDWTATQNRVNYDVFAHPLLSSVVKLGLKRVKFFPYRVPQFLIERVIELSSIFPMARMSNLQPKRTHF